MDLWQLSKEMNSNSFMFKISKERTKFTQQVCYSCMTTIQIQNNYLYLYKIKAIFTCL